MNCSSSNGQETIYQLTRIGPPATIRGVADVFKLKQDVSLVGRAKEKVQVFIDSSKHKGLISRIHARIFKSKTQTGQDMFKICDTSLNGTFVNDIKILNEAYLKPGDTIAFGHLQGAALQAGKRYSQPNSEFQFKFEISSKAQFCLENSDPEDTDCCPLFHKTPTSDFSNLSTPLETPTPMFVMGSADRNFRQPMYSTKRKLVKNFDTSEEESETEYKILQEYASAASSAAVMQSDSDEDLFAIKYTNILPGGVPEMLENNEICKDPEKKTLKRKKSEKASHSSKHTESGCLDSCSAMKCLMPNEKLVSWVQCDDCDQWYHVKCAGLTLKLVKPKNAKFHCGCI